MTRWNEEEVKKIADAHFLGHVVACIDPHRLVWSHPRSSNSRVHYLIHGNVLMVWGDLGFAMYAWSQNISWEFLVGLNLDYFAGKCEASEVGRGFEVWDPTVAKDALTAIVADRKEEVEDFDENPSLLLGMVEDDRAFEALSTREEWLAWVSAGDHHEEFWEFGDLGMDIHARCVLHLEGLKRANR